jgi:hypothetical protein
MGWVVHLQVAIFFPQMRIIYGVTIRLARSGATIWKCLTFQV